MHLIITTTRGVVIRMHVSDISQTGRNTQGVKIINIKEKESVVSLTIVPHVDESEEEIVVTETPTEAVVEEVVTPDALEEN